jgi:DNA-binding beta-propeller fold protein YncE
MPRRPHTSLSAPLFATILLIAPVSAAHAIATDYLFSFGSFGTGDGQFNSPQRLAIGPSGAVYVLDSGNQRIEKFDAEGNFITKWVSARPGTGNLTGLDVGPDGKVYALLNTVIQVFDANGVYSFPFFFNFGSSSSTSTDLEFDPAGNLLVFDTQASTCMARRSPSAANLGLVFCYGEPFGGPAVDADGEVFFCSSNSGLTPERIYKRTPAGAAIMNWDAQVHRLNTDAAGNLYGVDFLGDAVRMYDNNGAFLGQFGSPGSGPGQFHVPYDIAVGPDGRIYVADRDNHRIQVFGTGPVPTVPMTWGRIKADYR